MDAYSVALGTNFIVSWTILKISKPTTISGEYVIFFDDQVDPLGTPWLPLDNYRIPLGDAYKDTLGLTFLFLGRFLNIYKVFAPT